MKNANTHHEIEEALLHIHEALKHLETAENHARDEEQWMLVAGIEHFRMALQKIEHNKEGDVGLIPLFKDLSKKLFGHS